MLLDTPRILPALLSAFFLAHTTNVNANSPYYSTTNLGSPNDEAAAGNPLKGFLTNPDWSPPPYIDDIPSSLEFYYIGLDKVMTGPNTFDWDTHLETRLNDSASRNKHVILRFQLDNPGLPSFVPQFLIDGGLAFNSYDTWGGGQSPDYNDANLLQALDDFISEFGAKYDGDPRLGFIQVGLLGFWGEWHTYTNGSGVTEGWIPDSTKDFVVDRFDAAFDATPLQVRYPYAAAHESGFGFHDDSFAYSTLDGDANGGGDVGWFFWPSVVSPGYTDFWKTSVMGGELRPELQSSIFSDSYPTATPYHQDFNLCTDVTHSTYSLNYYAFSTGYSGVDLTRAIAANHRMGYAFRVTKAEASVGTSSSYVDVSVTVEQTGVAPFYYPLGLTLECPGGVSSTIPGVDAIMNKGDSQVFTFTDIPAILECLDQLSISLSSNHVYPGNPVKFAQGPDGTTVSVSVPLPPAQSRCTDRNDCLGDGNTGAVESCGETQCDSLTGLCSFNAWVGTCDSFTTCGGNDDYCTKGPTGSTGTCTGWANNECVYQYYPVTITNSPVTLSDDDFETGWGSFTRNDLSQSGCDDTCRRSDSGKARDNWSLRIRDNSGAASSVYSGELDISAYNTLTVDFWFYPDSMDDSNEDFFLEYSTNPSNDGSWISIQSWAKNADFSNGVWYNPSVQYDVSSINEPIKIRFRCDASGNGDRVYIDDVTISAS